MKVNLEIQRFNPETDTAPHFKTYEVVVDPTDRVLDALMDIKRNTDGSLAFRRSCAHGVCGSDAMVINGTEALACKTLIQDVTTEEGATIRIEPARHMKVQRDLMVEQEGFFQNFRSVKPFFIPDDSKQKPEKEYAQSIEERAQFDDPTKCILCGACYSACPVLDKNPNFIGPAAIVQASRFVFDSRDSGLGARLEILDQPDGVWACENHFECTRVCPREIKVTKMINFTKRAIKQYRDERGEQVNDGGAQA
ncbi:MAG: succinate dehydrogenase iron-sulfur subunit [Spirochaetaceae bacterium]|nr:MAG: succinate dehydrogenase iron-sulfur subunit [Spirochaetaceae bacterium]